MKDQKNQSPSVLTTLFLSWFYTGKFPKAPGTIGSLATIPFIIFLHTLQINIYSLIALIILLFIVSVVVTERVQNKYHLHDPQWIVIDEVLGMLVTWAFVQRIDFVSLLIIFGTFRFFDIVKIWPASYFDKMHHGFGTITDDIVSGIYAGIVTGFIVKFLIL